MECDSAHRCIENQISKQDVNVPHDYVNIIRRARKNPPPYEVRFNEVLSYSFFKNYECKQDVNSFRPGNRVHDMGPKNIFVHVLYITQAFSS